MVEPLNSPGQELRSKRRQNGNGDHTTSQSSQLLRAPHDGLYIDEDPLERGEHFASRGGEGDAPFAAIEERDAESFFELANLRSEGRLGDVQFTCGARKVADAGCREKSADMLQVVDQCDFSIMKIGIFDFTASLCCSILP